MDTCENITFPQLRCQALVTAHNILHKVKVSKSDTAPTFIIKTNSAMHGAKYVSPQIGSISFWKGGSDFSWCIYFYHPPQKNKIKTLSFLEKNFKPLPSLHNPLPIAFFPLHTRVISVPSSEVAVLMFGLPLSHPLSQLSYFCSWNVIISVDIIDLKASNIPLVLSFDGKHFKHCVKIKNVRWNVRFDSADLCFLFRYKSCNRDKSHRLLKSYVSCLLWFQST